jgi:hypothetical protein
MERKHLKLGILIGILSFSSMLVILWFATMQFRQSSIDSQQYVQNDIPRWGNVLGGEGNLGYNITRAKHWAKLSGFALAVPQGYYVQSIRVNRFIQESSGPDQRTIVSGFTVYLTRGLVLTAQKAPANFEDKARRALSERGDNAKGTADIVKISGEFGIHYAISLKDDPIAGSSRALIWVNGNTLFHLYTTMEEFSLEEFLKIAESIKIDS